MYKLNFIQKFFSIFFLIAFVSTGLSAENGSSKIISPEAPFVWGDVNGDQKANIVDALLIASYSVGSIKTLMVPEAGDVTGENSINIIDALYIARKYVGMIKRFPVEDAVLTSKAVLNEKFRLNFGETREILNENLKITFKRIIESRCPSNVVCKWEGEALVYLEIKFKDEKPEIISLSSRLNKVHFFRRGEYTIQCLSVEPQREKFKAIPDEDYTAVLLVRKNKPTPTPLITSKPREVLLDRSFKIKYNEKVDIDNRSLSLKFVNIKDKRCPKNTPCIGGQADVQIEINHLILSWPQKHVFVMRPLKSYSLDFANYTITCLELDPYPADEKPIAPEHYSAKFIVKKKPKANPSPEKTHTPPSDFREVKKGEKFKLYYGDTVKLAKGHCFISFSKVIDQPCPEGKDCPSKKLQAIGLDVQEGSVRPRMFYIKYPPSFVMVDNRIIIYCLSVDFNPIIQSRRSPEDYVATLIIQDDKMKPPQGFIN